MRRLKRRNAEDFVFVLATKDNFGTPRRDAWARTVPKSNMLGGKQTFVMALHEQHPFVFLRTR